MIHIRCLFLLLTLKTASERLIHMLLSSSIHCLPPVCSIVFFLIKDLFFELFYLFLSVRILTYRMLVYILLVLLAITMKINLLD
jgi:hypothetical protein